MDQAEILSGLALELRRGTIVLCVLSKLKKPMYGYHLVNALSLAGVPVEANTLYPLLRRLEGQGLLQSEWEMGDSKPRKYYRVTPAGDAVRQGLKRMWQTTQKSVNAILEDEADEV